MKLYTVFTDRLVPGIVPQPYNDKLAILFGPPNKGVAIYLDEEWGRRLVSLAKREAELDGRESLELRPIVNADFPYGSRILPRPINEEATQAMVLIRPEAPEEESTWAVTTAFWTEDWDPKREAVKRTYWPVAFAAGVDVVLEHAHGILLVVDRGATFRVETKRGGKMRNHLYQFRDWRWPKLEKLGARPRKEEEDREAA